MYDKNQKILTNDYISKTKIPDSGYVINPYVGCPHKCMYCYAEFMRRLTNHNEPWGDFLDVKINPKPLNVNRLIGKCVSIGTVTDAYNKYEAKYNITKKILESLVNVDTEISILTKSNLVIRDIDLFKKMKNTEITFSLNTLDDMFRKDMEPFASSVSERIETLKLLSKNGIKTSVFLSPMFPGITDFKPIIKTLKNYSKSFWFKNLDLYPHCVNKILKYIDIKYPKLKNLYYEIYKVKNMTYWENMEKEIVKFCKENKIEYTIYFYHNKIKKKNLPKKVLKTQSDLDYIRKLLTSYPHTVFIYNAYLT
jgi:DNA repair photolyase